MRKLYFLIVLAASFATQAQIVNIPDANFKAKLLSASPSNTIAKNLAGNYFKIDDNNDGEIQESEAFQVSELNIDCYVCNENQKVSEITGINFFSSLLQLSADNNNISTLDIQNLVLLGSINFTNNVISFINLQNLGNLTMIQLQNNMLTNIDVSQLISLDWLDISNNLITILDLSANYNLNALLANNNQLNSINIKNGSTYFNGLLIHFEISNNPNLQYICVNESNFYYFGLNNFKQEYSNFYFGNPNYLDNVEINSYCSMTPGPVYNDLFLNSILDADLNGCDVNDFILNNFKYKIEDNNNLSHFYISQNQLNSLKLLDGNYTITPILEQPNFYDVSPINLTVNFPSQSTPFTQSFCVFPNGTYKDLESVLIPTSSARPGFDAHYTIIYKNKGHLSESGTISLTYYENTVLDLVSSNPPFNSQTANTLVWNYTNLQPSETRTIDVVFNVNSPTEAPAVNIGDQLNFSTTINPVLNDNTPFDNSSGLKQTVVGSYDPNDKTCIEGTTVGPDMIGQYVHYVIRFENTGTYPAENIVVKDMIDLAKFDVSTLIPSHSSHDFVTRIAENKVEFIFEGINLPFDDANNDGYIAFKIKTKPNLVVGDTFSNNASIYFDYNFPIITNTYTTTIAALSTTDFDFGTHITLYPNPVKEVLNFQSKDNTTINSIEIYNTLGQIVLAVPNTISTVDVSNLQSGNYFVKVNTDLGVSNTKFIKE